MTRTMNDREAAETLSRVVEDIAEELGLNPGADNEQILVAIADLKRRRPPPEKVDPDVQLLHLEAGHDFALAEWKSSWLRGDDHKARAMEALLVAAGYGWPATPRDVPAHAIADDLAVERFAEAMKLKMARGRAKGRSGWDDPDDCPEILLARMLVAHMTKGNAENLIDVALLAMMLQLRGGNSAVLQQAMGEHRARLLNEARLNLPKAPHG